MGDKTQMSILRVLEFIKLGLDNGNVEAAKALLEDLIEGVRKYPQLCDLYEEMQEENKELDNVSH